MNKYFCVIFFLFFLTNCQATEAKFSSSVNDPITTNGKSTVNLTCDSEQAVEKSYPVGKNTEDYEFIVEASCPKQSHLNRQANLAKSLHIIFVLKFTKSMESNLDLIASNIHALQDQLNSHDWTVKYAGIGFSKYFRTFYVSNFLDAESFVKNLKSWSTFETKDDPVAGQMAIAAAVDKFLSIKEKAPQRLDNSRNILYFLSDSPSYTEKSESDFSIDNLASKIQMSQIPNLELFYSIPNTITELPSENPSTIGQLQDLIKKTSINSTKLDFPLNDKSFESMAKQLEGLAESSGEICKLDSLTFVANEGQITSSNELRDKNVFDIAQAKTPFIFKASSNPKTSDYSLRINRCCVKNKSTSCESTDTVKLVYKLKDLDS